MSGNLVCHRIRWKMEGAKLMADMEMIKIATGERTRFMADGSVVKDEVDPPKIEWCDRCETFKRSDGGRYDFVMGSPELWYCELCK
jgi:hypothetical protein